MTDVVRGARWARVAWFAVLAVASTARAQQLPDEPATAEARPAPKELFRGRELLDFTDPVEVKGQVIGPDGRLVAGAPRLVFKPIIELRHDWNDEMKASIDGVK